MYFFRFGRKLIAFESLALSNSKRRREKGEGHPNESPAVSLWILGHVVRSFSHEAPRGISPIL